MTAKDIVNKNFPKRIRNKILNNWKILGINGSDNYVVDDNRYLADFVGWMFNWYNSIEGDFFWRQYYDELLRKGIKIKND
jgi:hypothetical protein